MNLNQGTEVKLIQLANKCCNGNDVTNNLLEDVQFIREKIGHIEKRAIQEYQDLQDSIIKMAKEDKRVIAKIKKLSKEKKKYGNVDGESVEYPSLKFNHGLYFEMDSLFMEIKRCMEFMIKCLASLYGKDITKVNVGAFINHLEPKSTMKKSDFIKILHKEHPDYIKYLSSEIEWLKKIQEMRTNCMHYRILNQNEKFIVEIVRDHNMNSKDSPKIIPAELKIEGIEISHLIRPFIDKLDLFIDKTSDLMAPYLTDK